MKNRIRELRKESKIEATELASKLDITTRTLYKIENGETDISSRILIICSEIFECSIDYLLLRSNYKERITSETRDDNFLREVIKNARI